MIDYATVSISSFKPKSRGEDWLYGLHFHRARTVARRTYLLSCWFALHPIARHRRPHQFILIFCHPKRPFLFTGLGPFGSPMKVRILRQFPLYWLPYDSYFPLLGFFSYLRHHELAFRYGPTVDECSLLGREEPGGVADALILDGEGRHVANMSCLVVFGTRP